MDPLQKEMRDLATWGMENTEVLNDCFTSVFTSTNSNRVTEGKGRNWENEKPPTAEDQV